MSTHDKEEQDKINPTPLISNVKDCDFCRCENYEKLQTYDWLGDIPRAHRRIPYVEVRFKNTRKDFFINANGLRLRKGDIVAVEASPGHDIGIVSLTGDLVLEQMRKHNVDFGKTEFRKIYRKAKQADVEKWREAIELEHHTMIESRKIADDLRLNMKIGDVEYQGDKTKAIFYYIADERVDFRQLIKVLAEVFRIRIEMRQIGARQEAGRIGGIGSCGRELCCATWMSNFVSVTTNAARAQEISLNPQKLAGQCGKLKCCLNYELGCYLDAQKDFPEKNHTLKTKQGIAYYNKTDIYRRVMWYSFQESAGSNLTPVPIERVKEIIEINEQGKEVEFLIDPANAAVGESLDFQNVVGQESLTRFEEKKPKGQNKSRSKSRKSKRKKGGQSSNRGGNPRSASGQGGRKPSNKGGNPKRNKPKNQNGGNSSNRKKNS